MAERTRWVAGPVVALTVVGSVVAVAPVARAEDPDPGDDVFRATIVFEQGYFGAVHAWNEDAAGFENLPRARGTFGAALRAEVLAGRYVGVGVDGGFHSAHIGEGGAIPGPAIDSSPHVLLVDARHSILAANLFLTLRTQPRWGPVEYYLMGGGGPALIAHRDGADAYGPGVAGTNGAGWTAFGRLGVRGELAPGFGALVELGFVHREHQHAFTWAVPIAGTSVVNFDYVSTQFSAVLGWYLAL